MGNKGAIALSQMLTVNNTLSKLILDENQIGMLGFWHIKDALKFNRSLRDFIIPYQDILRVMNETTTDKIAFQKIIHKIDIKIRSNQKSTS